MKVFNVEKLACELHHNRCFRLYCVEKNQIFSSVRFANDYLARWFLTYSEKALAFSFIDVQFPKLKCMSKCLIASSTLAEIIIDCFLL